MNESQFTRNVHKRLPVSVKSWKIIDQYEGGVPDAFYRLRRRPTPNPLWIEYKYLKSLPQRPTTRIKANLSALQREWLKSALEGGEDALVVVGVGSKGVVMSLDEAIEGIERQEFDKRLLNYQSLADFIEERLK